MVEAKQLYDWSVIAQQDWRSLLLGNGFSMNISSGFGYSRLFDKAPLSDIARDVFGLFGTTNFELMLEQMFYTQRINGVFGFPETGIKRMEAERDGIRAALFSAVNQTHVRHADLAETSLQAIAGYLREYERVFTTNYDLLPYWAIMSSPVRDGFRDMFRNQADGLTFDPSMALWNPPRTLLFYLHGALHLWRDDWSQTTGKWDATVTGLLELEQRYEEYPAREPLLVSEGTAEHKAEVIQRSRYLRFALQELTRDTAPIVVVGFSFGKNDEHIVDAIKAGAAARKIAIGIHVGGKTTPVQLNRVLAELRARFEGHEIVFFDVATHPLGDRSYSVE